MSEIVRGKKDLTPRQLRAIDALLSAKNLGDAAKSAGITERTLLRWRQQPHFRAAVLTAEGEALGDLARRLIGGNVAALATVGELMRRADSEGVKLRAAEIWLGLSVKLYELRTLEERLTRLEAQWGQQYHGETKLYSALDIT